MEEGHNPFPTRVQGKGRSSRGRRGRGPGRGRGRGRGNASGHPQQPSTMQPYVYGAPQGQFLDPSLAPPYNPALYANPQRPATPEASSAGRGESGDWHRKYASAASPSQTLPSTPSSSTALPPLLPRPAPVTYTSNNIFEVSPNVPGAAIVSFSRPSTPPGQVTHIDTSDPHLKLDWFQKFASPPKHRSPYPGSWPPVIAPALANLTAQNAPVSTPSGLTVQNLQVSTDTIPFVQDSPVPAPRVALSPDSSSSSSSSVSRSQSPRASSKRPAPRKKRGPYFVEQARKGSE